MADQLKPQSPQEEGVDTSYPDTDEQEGVHLLANQAQERLKGEGFSEQQIFEWAAAYIDREGTGTVEGLLTFIEERESDSTS